MKPFSVIDKKELAHLEYEVLIDRNKYMPANDWCIEQFGSRWSPIDNRSGSWSMFWAGRDHIDKYRFCFANKEDLMMFILRWS